MNKRQAKKLFTKYVNNECSKEELELLNTFLDSYQGNSFGGEDYRLIEDESFRSESWSRIEKQLFKKTDKVYSFKIFYKYAAILLVVLTVSFYFFQGGFFSEDFIESNQELVGDIEIGTDKAILTLEDGEVVALEEDKIYETTNVKSDGQGIVYNAEASNLKTEYHSLTIPRGGQFFVELSDGTKVWLNSETKLRYPVIFKEGETRQVELVYGEAYFDVSPSSQHKGARFKVLNNKQEVEVLGTKFNLKAYKDETNTYTTLVEGKVSVMTAGEDIILHPNQQSVLNEVNNHIEISAVDVNENIGWVKGDFVFYHKPLKDIAVALERWYNVDIEFQSEELKDVKFNGELSKYQSIEEILQLISNTKPIKSYEINNKTIVIK
ncbi:FecR family protein [Aestuariibaculum suncheonense]|uniref:FecR family protein n=1 Tax=Aestuariibaculum suncheonense TaxID=1028745 RepID=A0A8J6UB78_9FLAO|nr:FecR family protein [Aestuariibaculum suncheonense]MBD0836068.1 FecR family protein [Aestuariibaculum suncheonense]